MQGTEPISKLLEQHRGHALIVESVDWDDVITPALVQLGQLGESGTLTLGDWATISRVLFEAVYQMGYERGRRNGKPLAFQVREGA